MNRIAQFHKVSKEQFIKDWEDYGEKIVNTTDTNDKGSQPLSQPGSIYEDIPLPRRATMGSAGYDFFSPIDFSLKPGESITIPTGIRAEIDDGWVLQTYPRSGLGVKFRLQINNTVGIIDSDYFNSDNEGHIFIKLTNDSNEGKEATVVKGMGFAQGLFIPFGITRDDMVTETRNGGHGSTDKKG